MLTMIVSRFRLISLHIRYELATFRSWWLSVRVERQRDKIEHLRECLIRNGDAKWLAEYDAECEKLDEEIERNAA